MVFDNEDFVYGYTRAQAIADGMLVDVTESARAAGFLYPTAVTANVWARCVEVPLGVAAETSGRLREVLVAAVAAVRASRGQEAESDQVIFAISAVYGAAQSGVELRRDYELIVRVGPGDDLSPVITIMFPEDD